MVVCGKCGVEVEEYASGKKCRECYNAYMREYVLRRYHERRARYVAQFGGVCVRCGGLEDLNFDHVNPAEKSFEISGNFWSLSEKRIQAELEKCQLLCRPCHREKSTREIKARVYECCGRTFVGLPAYRGHHSWGHKKKVV